ncbi:MAG: hypothetical protein NTW11_02375, partial [Candidatus Staskawiczbacteria bacterium]|nr:hypothetical protein [Candidatus Staskawiczbacteria bacterium]
MKTPKSLILFSILTLSVLFFVFPVEIKAACGNNVIETGEDCDGTARGTCAGNCRSDCTCPIGQNTCTSSTFSSLLSMSAFLSADSCPGTRRQIVSATPVNINTQNCYGTLTVSPQAQIGMCNPGEDYVYFGTNNVYSNNPIVYSGYDPGYCNRCNSWCMDGCCYPPSQWPNSCNTGPAWRVGNNPSLIISGEPNTHFDLTFDTVVNTPGYKVNPSNPTSQYPYAIIAAATFTPSVCGNGTKQPGEECDATIFPGALGAGGCSADKSCQADCTCKVPCSSSDFSSLIGMRTDILDGCAGTMPQQVVTDTRSINTQNCNGNLSVSIVGVTTCNCTTCYNGFDLVNFYSVNPDTSNFVFGNGGGTHCDLRCGYLTPVAKSNTVTVPISNGTTTDFILKYDTINAGVYNKGAYAEVTNVVFIPSTCGNGTKQPGEECDTGVSPFTGGAGFPGAINAGTCTGGTSCTSNCTCKAPVCGDGWVEFGETCDTTTFPGDLGVGCSADKSCQSDCICKVPACGDGVTQGTEECDTGVSPFTGGAGFPGAINAGGCIDDKSCTSDCTCKVPTCGDGTKEAGEECDTTTFPGDLGAGGCLADQSCQSNCTCAAGNQGGNPAGISLFLNYPAAFQKDSPPPIAMTKPSLFASTALAQTINFTSGVTTVCGGGNLAIVGSMWVESCSNQPMSSWKISVDLISCLSTETTNCSGSKTHLGDTDFRATTNATTSFSASFPLPAGIKPGIYTVQLSTVAYYCRKGGGCGAPIPLVASNDILISACGCPSNYISQDGICISGAFSPTNIYSPTNNCPAGSVMQDGICIEVNGSNNQSCVLTASPGTVETGGSINYSLNYGGVAGTPTLSNVSCGTGSGATAGTVTCVGVGSGTCIFTCTGYATAGTYTSSAQVTSSLGCSTPIAVTLPQPHCDNSKHCVVGGTGISCSVVGATGDAECASTQPYCNTNQKCTLGGTGIICPSVNATGDASCSLSQPYCSVGQQCIFGGTGITCPSVDATGNAVCVNQPYCNDSLQCVVGATGLVCPSVDSNGNTHCQVNQPRCNDNNQCVVGGTGILCLSADAAGDDYCRNNQSHCNNNKQCVVGGTGISCLSADDCIVRQPYCNTNQKCTLGGTGIICSSVDAAGDADCTLHQPYCSVGQQCIFGGTGITCPSVDATGNAVCVNQPYCNDSLQCVVGATGLVCPSVDSNGNTHCQVNQPIVGTCGPAAKLTPYSYSDTDYFGAMCGNGNGIASPVSPYVNTLFPDPGNSTIWTCGGLNTGADSVHCTATREATPVDGVCGYGATPPAVYPYTGSPTPIPEIDPNTGFQLLCS